jgi:hypothetical protein
MLTDYTSYDAVRAILGVSPKEIKDTALALPQWESQFLLEMGDVDSGVGAVMTEYAVVKAKAPNTRSTNEQRFFDIVNILAGYSTARQLLTGLPLAIPQEITDGKAAVHRFDAKNFEKVRDGVIETYANLLRRLKAVLLILVPTAAVVPTPTRVFAAGVGIGIDPVTGV